MEGRRPVRLTTHAPERTGRLIKVQTPIRTGEARHSRKTGNLPTRNTPRGREGRLQRCRAPLVQRRAPPALLMATARQPRQQAATSTLLIMATFIRTPAAAGRAPT